MFLNIVCLCAAAVCVFGAPSTDVVPLERQQPTVIPIVEQFAETEANGTYRYSYETRNGIKREEVSYDKVLPKTRSAVSSDDDEDDNNEIHVQQGSYSYTAPDGTFINVRYIADENGFRAVGNHLPKPPSILVAASASRVSGRRSQTVDSDAGGSSLSAIAAAPIIVADIPLASSQSSNAFKNLEVESKIADTSVVQASVPKSGAQVSSTTPEAPSTTEVPSTAEPITSTTEQVSTSKVTSTEQLTTAAVASTSEASSEPSTAGEPATTPTESTPNATPGPTSNLDAAPEAATTASA